MHKNVQKLQSENYRNRHGYFSMNVQTICDANLRIMNVVARWPGSAHDATIFANSDVRQELERGKYGNYLIVGDGGYPNSEYLCTPFRAGANLNAAQIMYQKCVVQVDSSFYFYYFLSLHSHFTHRAQIATRNVVERMYGVLKRRFPILHSGMQLRRTHLIQQVISVCCVLHNLCIDMGDTIDLDAFGVLPANEDVEDEAAPPPQLNRQRRLVRDEIVATFAGRILLGDE